MVDPINAATPAPGAFPHVENNNNGQKNQEEVFHVQTEETSNANSLGKSENNEKVSNAQVKEKDHAESAQRDNEANAKPRAPQDESRGTMVDILG